MATVVKGTKRASTRVVVETNCCGFAQNYKKRSEERGGGVIGHVTKRGASVKTKGGADAHGGGFAKRGFEALGSLNRFLPPGSS